jgi:DNA-binding MarR family transcriptional regulator
MHSDRLHHLLMDLFRTAGLVLGGGAVPGRPSSLSQVFALHELDREVGLSQRELAERLGLEKSTVSRLVTDLEADGLVTRDRDPANRRLYRLEITEAGRATEVDHLNGEIVALARAHGLRAPVNERLVALVHEAEGGERREWTGEDLLAELRR